MMSPQFEMIEKEALLLSTKERELLAEKLIRSIENYSQEEIDNAWEVEIEQRTAMYEEGKITAYDVRDIINKLRATR